MKYILLVVVILLASCSRSDGYRETELKEYVSIYFHKTGHDIPEGLKYIYADIPNKDNLRRLGTCFPINTLVLINKLYWYDFEDFKQEMIIAHELAHCVVSAEHDNRLKADGCPESLMISETKKMTEDCWNEYKDEYYEKVKRVY